MTPKSFFEPVAHQEAVDLLKSKLPVTREVFDRMLPEIKARAITVKGVEDADVLQNLRDRIADIPAGAGWEEVKREIADTLSPWLGDEKKAEHRAETLLRTHAFQAYEATSYDAMMETRVAFPYWQYHTMGDANVRDSHAALDGLVLPADSPFWNDHFPPWDWGCRCTVIALSPEEVDKIREEDRARNPEDRRVIEGNRLDRLEKAGEIQRGPVRLTDPNDPEMKRPLLNENGVPVVIPAGKHDVRSPKVRGDEGAFGWNPGDLRIPLTAIRERYDKATWNDFTAGMRNSYYQTSPSVKGEPPARRKVWDWLLDPARNTARREIMAAAKARRVEMAVAVDYDTGKRVRVASGTERNVQVGELVEDAKRAGRRIIIDHGHPSDGAVSFADLSVLVRDREVVEAVGTNVGMMRHTTRLAPGYDDRVANDFANRLDVMHRMVEKGSMSADAARRIIESYMRRGLFTDEEEIIIAR